MRMAAAATDLTSGFNRIALHAADLRSAMRVEDADAFDAVMLDIMGALMALPTVGVAHSGDPARITPRTPRYDRIPQIAPDLSALEKFFGRLQEAGLSASNGRMFARARKDARKMLAALPYLLPTVTAKGSLIGNPRKP